MNETKVDVLARIAAAWGEDSQEYKAVAHLIEAAREASATLGHAYHTALTGQIAVFAHEDYQRLDAALARIGGDK